MSRRFKIETALTNARLAAFQSLIARRQTTIDTAHAWLIGHGCIVSRGAVWNFMRHQQARPTAFPTRIGNDADARCKLAGWIKLLKGNDLRAVARFAEFLTVTTPKKGKVRRPI